MNEPLFLSGLATSMTEFVVFKRAVGYAYEAVSCCRLRHFDRFLWRNDYAQSFLSGEILELYRESIQHHSAWSRSASEGTVQRFSNWLHLIRPESAPVSWPPIRRPKNRRYFLYSQEQVAAMIRAARLMQTPGDDLRPHTMAMLIGLLYVTGLRIGEALALNVGDIDLVNRRLWVRHGKGGKERFVMLDETTVPVLNDYLERRACFHPGGRCEPLFCAPGARRISYNCVHGAFHSVLQECDIGTGAAAAPRIHDMRHSYACACLHQWYDRKLDLNAMLPVLVTALGHVGLNESQVYLHVNAEILQKAADRFNTTFTNNIKGVRS